jgi:hypothetical protein
VKELFNCVSMIPWIVSSAFGAWQCWRRDAARWVTTGYCLSLSIAIGSYLFHAELTRFTQALDELPMLWLGLHATALFHQITGWEWTRGFGRHADAVLLGGASIITYLYTCTEQ